MDGSAMDRSEAAGPNDIDPIDIGLIDAPATEMEADAERMLAALAALTAAGRGDALDAERYALRLRFALDRLDDLKKDARRNGGVFAPARVEVALSILETHVRTAAVYVSQAVRRARRAPGRREAHVSVDTAVQMVEDLAA